MFKKLEGWLFNVFAGKVLARAAVTVAAYIAGPVVQGIAAKAGVKISVDPAELQAGMVLGAHAAYEWYKNLRAKAPAPAVPDAPVVK